MSKKNHPSFVCIQKTGKSLGEWGDKYNLSRERVRQLLNKWGTITDELMLSRNRSSAGPGRPRTRESLAYYNELIEYPQTIKDRSNHNEYS